jgi:hypothetical protein
MKIVVTGEDQDGRAVEIRRGPLWEKSFEKIDGLRVEMAWGTEPGESVPLRASAQPAAADPRVFLPPPGATRFFIGDFPPDSVIEDPRFDAAGAGAEQAAFMPEFVSKFDHEEPGMHATDTVDYVIVLEGEIDLETGDGSEPIKLFQGDVVVEGGIRHALRNRSDQVAKLAIVFIGAERG